MRYSRTIRTALSLAAVAVLVLTWTLDYNECYIVKVGANVTFTPAHY